MKGARLMRAMGSKTGSYDPESPDWWLLMMNHCDDPRARLLAYFKSKTVARGHDSPIAIDEKTRDPINLKRTAHDLGWHPENTRKYIADVVAIGLLEATQDSKGKFAGYCLKADVPFARRRRNQRPDPSLTEGEEKVRNSSLYRLISPALHKQIQQLSDGEQKAMQKAADVFVEWGVDHLESDAVAAARAMKDVIENIILGIAGLEKPNGRKAPTDRQRLIQDIVLAIPLPEVQSVQTEKTPLYSAENGSVQTAEFAGENGVKSQQQQQPAANGQARASSTQTKLHNKDVGRSVEDEPELTDRPTVSPLYKELEELLIRRLSGRLGDIPTPKLLKATLKELSGAPLYLLDARISLRWKNIDSMGLVVDLARDVGNAHVTRAALEKTELRKAEQERDAQYQEMLRDIRGKWTDLAPEDQEWYRRNIPELANGAAGGTG